MHYRVKLTGTIVLFLGLAQPTYAQVCKEPNANSTNGKANLTCDMRYRNTLVTCDEKDAKDILGTRPACPKEPMPMLDTPKRSYYADYSPYLFNYPRDPVDRSLPYSGQYSIGTQGDATKNFQLFGNSAPGSKRISACMAQIKLDKDPKNAKEEAAFIRLQMDNCTNQYILNDAIYPYQKEAKEEVRPFSGEDPNDPTKRVTLESECQPLKTVIPKEEEYNASEYLALAWRKMLVDPGHRKTTGTFKNISCNLTKFAGNVAGQYDYNIGTVPCDREPHLPKGVTIVNKTPPPNELKNPKEDFPEVRLASIGAIPYEQILDPTHPFSPRWDFLITDREYSRKSASWAAVPKAAAIYYMLNEYMSAPDNTIFCAGVKKENGQNATADSYSGAGSMNTSGLSSLSDGLKKVDTSSWSSNLSGGANSVIEATKQLTPAATSALSEMQNGNMSALGSLSSADTKSLNTFLNDKGWGDIKNIDLNSAAAKIYPDGLKKTIADLQKIDIKALQGKDIKGLQSFTSNLSPEASNLLQSATKAGFDPKLVMQAGETVKAFQDANINPDTIKTIAGVQEAGKKLGISDETMAGFSKIADSAKGLGAQVKELPVINQVTKLAEQNNLSAKDFRSLTDFDAAAKKIGANPEALAKAQDLIDSAKKGLQIDPAALDSAKTMVTQAKAAGLNMDSYKEGMAAFSALKGSYNYSELFNTAQYTNKLQALGQDFPQINSLANAYTSLSTSGISLNSMVDAGTITSKLQGMGFDTSTLIQDNQIMNSLNQSMSGATNNALASLGKTASGVNMEKYYGKSKKPNEIEVDVLEFRRKAFEDALLRRTTYNYVCKVHEAQYTSGNDGYFLPDGAMIPVFFGSYCSTITRVDIYQYPYVWGKDKDCWKCFGLDGKVDDENEHPPCTTNYLGKDLKMKLSSGYIASGLNLWKQSAQCNYPGSARNDKYRMDNVCKNLRKPFTPLNKLKMRYHNMDEEKHKDDNVLVDGYMTSKNGALEGLSFKEYFGDHMPYPRLWDTGTSLHKTPQNDPNFQHELDSTGQYTTIVGIGREAAAKSASDNAPEDANKKKAVDTYKDERCKSMGWRSPAMALAAGAVTNAGGTTLGAEDLLTVRFGGVTIDVPDPVTSWTEMKLYQARTMRNSGLSCLGRYEKVFKHGSAENMILLATGAEWQNMVISKCKKLAGGLLEKHCPTMTVKEYVKATKGNSSKPNADEGTVYLHNQKPEVWPSAWRGYMASGGMDITAKNKFPNFGSNGTIMGMGGSAYAIGLNNAEEGDIIMLPFGAKNNPLDKPGLAKLALVIETNLAKNGNCEQKENCYVKVLEPDNGKMPDICGTTDTWGEMKTRYYFKPGHLDPGAKEEYERIRTTSSCEESRISHCEMGAWNTLGIYRIRNDIRKGCEEDKAINCPKKKG